MVRNGEYGGDVIEERGGMIDLKNGGEGAANGVMAGYTAVRARLSKVVPVKNTKRFLIS
jgi:hypothetical protein